MDDIKNATIAFLVLGVGLSGYSLNVVGDVLGAYFWGGSYSTEIKSEYTYKLEHKRAKSSGPIWYVYVQHESEGLEVISLTEVDTGKKIYCTKFKNSCFNSSNEIFDYAASVQLGSLFIGLVFILLALVVVTNKQKLLKLKEKYGDRD